MKTLLVYLFVGVSVFSFAVSAYAEEPRHFSSGYAGSRSGDPKLSTRTYFNTPSIRQLIYEMEAGPVNLDRVQEAIEGTEFSLEDLLRVRLLRREANKFYIDFNYFPLKDMQDIHRISEARIPSLVQAYLDNQAAFDKIFEMYPVQSVPKDKLAFVLIAGFSLNWDGLQITEDLGLRKPNFVVGENWRYSFWASEEDPEFVTREFYWGSSTFPIDDFNFEEEPVNYSFSSYGDPYSDPRMNFPDLLTLPSDTLEGKIKEIIEKIGTTSEVRWGFEFKNALGLFWTYDVAEVLFALRQGEKSATQLRAVVRNKKQLENLLSLLVEIEYIQQNDTGNYTLLIPIFDMADQQMINEALGLSRKILEEWFEKNYEDIKGGLSDLTALQHGVPYESLFTQIWHDLFGLTTRELVHSGFIADPRAENVRYRGSFGALWRNALYRLEIG